MSNEDLIYTQKGATAWLTLNRPKAMNSLSLSIVGRMEELLPQIAADDSVRVVVLTGAGSAFCAGADLKEVLAGKDLPPGEPDMLDRMCYNVMKPLRDFPKPVIAALNGITMAGGLELVMCCDIVLASEDARIGDAHANFGVYPGAGGAAVLPRLIPHNVAKYLLFTGKTLSAAEMKGYGLVNEVVPADQLEQATTDLAELIASKSPIALQRMKEVANASLDKSRDAALEHEQVLFRMHERSYDMAEGLRAFSEKRTPKFQGR
ncbi:MAG: enoyl-CoA hydratase/isomerase family protein [Gammaproteobacteria bacterium]|nr:MAG: enoyl-CoA hydratase/isomerase family protein [Gammaproteobacteria bacterium]RLA57809.1 MAG: enoyl-CoA hydratase/isomerase family protein [Gammaproteobacteria bacterium]HDY82019.1 enoyl-CoA hydratase/isomerase family protein [Halieaceae bacterium]